MDTLPSELVNLLFYYLTIPSIKYFRTVCRSFARIGEDHLFQNFEFRLYPGTRCLDQLEELIMSPIALRLRTLSYESGILLEWADYRYWKAQVYQAISSDFSRGITSDGISQETYRRFHTTLDARFTSDMGERYEQYRGWLDQEAALMAGPAATAKLRTLVGKIPQLESVKIVMSEPEITLPDLEAFSMKQSMIKKDAVQEFLDPRSRVQKRREDCLQHFISFLEAVISLPYTVMNFSAVSMPRELLNETVRRDSDVLRRLFRTSRRLSLRINEFPFSDWLSRGGQDIYFQGRTIAALQIVRLLRQSRELSSLFLEFPEGKQAEYSSELFDQTNLDRFPRVWLRGLKDFSLSNFNCNWDDLKALLDSALNVKSLTLRDCRLEAGHMIDLIYGLRSLQLKHICIEGHWVVNEDEGIWHSHSESSFTDCSVVTSYEGPYAAQGLRNKLERFILNGGSCPLPQWSLYGDEFRVWDLEGDTSWHYIPSFGI